MVKPSVIHEEIMHCIKVGIFSIVKRAKQHLEVYKLIANYKLQLDAIENKERQYLYFYLQQTALRLMILETAKLYDNSNSEKHETLSLYYFFKKFKTLEPEINWSKLFSFKQKQLSKSLLDKGLLQKLESLNSTDFLIEFKGLEAGIDDDLKTDLTALKLLRNKNIAHNEKVDFSLVIETNSIMNLINYAHDIAQTYCIIFNTGGYSWNSKFEDAYFVQILLNEDFGNSKK